MGNYISVLACIPPKLANYCLLSEQDIIKIITKSPAKSCAADPIPTELLKQHVDNLGSNLNQAGKHTDAIWLFSR